MLKTCLKIVNGLEKSRKLVCSNIEKTMSNRLTHRQMYLKFFGILRIVLLEILNFSLNITYLIEINFGSNISWEYFLIKF